MKEEPINNQEEASAEAPSISPATKLATTLRQRASRARKSATRLLFFVLIVSIFATLGLLLPDLIGFVFSKNKDGGWSVERVYSPMTAAKADYNTGYTYDYSGYDYSGGNYAFDHAYQQQRAAKVKGVDAGLRKLEEQLSESNRELSKITANQSELATNLAIMQRLFSEQGTVIKSLQKLVSASVAEKEKPNQERTFTLDFAKAVGTRLLVGALLVIILKWLISIYRYHVRLRAFYDAAADILELSPEDAVISVENLSSLLNPSSIDFTETSDTIVAHAIDLAKKATAS